MRDLGLFFMNSRLPLIASSPGQDLPGSVDTAFLLAGMENELLHLHGVIEVKPLFLAIERLMVAAVPPCLVEMAIMRLPWHPAVFYTTRYGFRDPMVAVNLLIPLLAAKPGRKFISPQDHFKTDEEYMASPMYRQVAKPEGWHHAYKMLFWRGKHLVAWVGVVRPRKAGKFLRPEIARIRKLRPQVQLALRRVLKVDRMQTARAAVEGFIDRSTLPSLVLDWDLRVAYRNRAAEDFCALWNFGPQANSLSSSEVFQVPAPVINACTALRHGIEARLRNQAPPPESNGFDPFAPTRHPDHENLSIRIKPMELRAARLGLPGFLVEMRDDGSPGGALKHSSSMNALTTREREIGLLIYEGLTNREIGTRLGCGEGTVKKHLTSIFRKLSVPNRASLMRLLAR